jgi:hypothetical protein
MLDASIIRIVGRVWRMRRVGGVGMIRIVLAGTGIPITGITLASSGRMDTVKV